MPWNQVKEVECFMEGLYKNMKEIASFYFISYNAYVRKVYALQDLLFSAACQSPIVGVIYGCQRDWDGRTKPE